MITSNPEATGDFAECFGKTLIPGDVVALYGDLGAGKTTFAKRLISSLTGTPSTEITSPTFTFMNPYEGDSLTIYHFDLYRLSTAENFIEMGFLDFLESSGISVIEWPEKIIEFLPEHTKHVKLKYEEKGGRFIYV